MAAISHTVGSDLDLDSSGGLAVVSGAEQTRQAILRRLLTNAGDYIWHLDYGAGIPARIGQPYRAQAIREAILAQMREEEAVDQSTPPTVTITENGAGTYLCAITYVDATAGTVQGLQFTM